VVDDNAESAEVPALEAEADAAGEDGSWPVLSDLDLAICIEDGVSPGASAPRSPAGEPGDQRTA
jgi:hypothetical protein